MGIQFDGRATTMKIGRASSISLVGVTIVLLAVGLLARSTAFAAPQPHTQLSAMSINMAIVEGIRLGPDKKMHDSFIPTDIAAVANQKIVVTVYNYDTGPHSFIADALHLNITIAASQQEGVPAITRFSFAVRRAGRYYWRCHVPCDDPTKGWAMRHSGYIAGTIAIAPA
jgi:hypothetical protein